MLAARFGGTHTDENADSLDVAASRDLIRTQSGGLNKGAATQQSRPRLHTQKITKDDRCGLSRLSKIAHMQGLRLWDASGTTAYASVCRAPFSGAWAL